MGTSSRDVAPDENTITVEVAFGKSTSSNYRVAVRLAKRFSSYQEIGEGTNVRHLIREQLLFDEESQWSRICKLGQLVGSWKSAMFALNGKPQQSMWQIERDVGEVHRCCGCRRQSILGESFCLGKDSPDDDPQYFGCRFITAITPQTESKYNSQADQKWYQFGDLSEDNQEFHIDAKQIASLVSKHTEKQLCTRCPYFDWDRVQDSIAELPAKITIDANSPFELKMSSINPTKALGIRPKRKDYGIHIPITIGGDDRSEDEQLLVRNVPAVRYTDVAAQDLAIEEIRNVVELPLLHPEYFRELRIEPQQGVILYGPPGNGKTLIAKAVATESDAHLEIINGPEIKSKWVGESEQNLRSAFVRAAKLQPSILLIDELDSLAPTRDGLSEQHDVSLISQLLVMLDGLESRGRVVVIGTTNRIEAIDPALRRPGRFDYHIHVQLPDRAGRLALLNAYMAKMKIVRNIDGADLLDSTNGFSGADIAGLCREAGLVAIRRALRDGTPSSETQILQDDMEEALKQVKSKRFQSTA